MDVGRHSSLCYTAAQAAHCALEVRRLGCLGCACPMLAFLWNAKGYACGVVRASDVDGVRLPIMSMRATIFSALRMHYVS
eukprot:6194001-Pleurochrysis_carterae.AAC.1